MAILKSIVTLIYRELLALGRKINIFKLIYTDICLPLAGKIY